MRERKAASLARRKWLMSWLRPLFIVIVIVIVGLFGLVKWREHRIRLAQERIMNTPDPMRGITSFGNEEAKFKLEITIPDSILAPGDLIVVLHRAVGIKPFKVFLQVIDNSKRDRQEDSEQLDTSVKINGKSEVEYLDEQGNRKTIKLKSPEMTADILARAITLAYQETYGDDDPEHPFHVEPPELSRSVQKRIQRQQENIDLNVDKMNRKM